MMEVGIPHLRNFSGLPQKTQYVSKPKLLAKSAVVAANIHPYFNVSLW